MQLGAVESMRNLFSFDVILNCSSEYKTLFHLHLHILRCKESFFILLSLRFNFKKKNTHTTTSR